MNDFRRKYFQGFREFEDMKKEFIRMKVGAGIRREEATAEADLLEETQVSAKEKVEAAKQQVGAAAKAEATAAAKAEELNEQFKVESSGLK